LLRLVLRRLLLNEPHYFPAAVAVTSDHDEPETNKTLQFSLGVNGNIYPLFSSNLV
jgi:hypothetical protein